MDLDEKVYESANSDVQMDEQNHDKFMRFDPISLRQNYTYDNLIRSVEILLEDLSTGKNHSRRMMFISRNPVQSDRFQSFCKSIASLNLVFFSTASMIKQLMLKKEELKIINSIHEFINRNRGILAQKQSSFNDKIDKVRELLGDLNKRGKHCYFIQIVENVGSYIIQELLGSGWRFRPIGTGNLYQRKEDKDPLKEILAALHDEFDQFYNSSSYADFSSIGSNESHQKIKLTSECLKALALPDNVLSDGMQKRNLLPLWIHIHEVCRRHAQANHGGLF